VSIKFKKSILTIEGRDAEFLIKELTEKLDQMKKEFPAFNYKIEGNTLLRNITVKSLNLEESAN